MANWFVDTHSFGPASLDTILGEMEVVIEAVVDTKSIQLCKVWSTGGGLYEGAIIIVT